MFESHNLIACMRRHNQQFSARPASVAAVEAEAAANSIPFDFAINRATAQEEENDLIRFNFFDINRYLDASTPDPPFPDVDMTFNRNDYLAFNTQP